MLRQSYVPHFWESIMKALPLGYPCHVTKVCSESTLFCVSALLWTWAKTHDIHRKDKTGKLCINKVMTV